MARGMGAQGNFCLCLFLGFLKQGSLAAGTGLAVLQFAALSAVQSASGTSWKECDKTLHPGNDISSNPALDSPASRTRPSPFTLFTLLLLGQDERQELRLAAQ